MMPKSHHVSPPLPDPILDRPPRARAYQSDRPFQDPPDLPGVQIPPPGLQLRSLQHGCYLLRYTPNQIVARHHYDGTLRVQRSGSTTTASGDLYLHKLVTGPFGTPPAEPSPQAGIPIFPRKDYRYYLRVTQIVQKWAVDSFTLGFEMWRWNPDLLFWSNEAAFTAQMTWKVPPKGCLADGDYLEGEVVDAWGAEQGRLTMAWVSPFLRKITVEVDRVSDSEYPGSNGAGIDWHSLFNQQGLEVEVYESDTNVDEASGASWLDTELHARMLQKRDSADLDTVWRYHLLCVRGLDQTSRGLMYDAWAADSNNVPREGAAIASHWDFPLEAEWGTVQGQRFGATPGPYFRTAVHELSHAMGLRHNDTDNGIMNTTDVIAASPGEFPDNILWSFNSEDGKKLRHMPDAWMRPGEIPWAPSYLAPTAPDEEALEVPGLSLEVTPLSTNVPIGAPVRVGVELKNDGERTVRVPATLSLKSEFVTGAVIGPHGEPRTFRSLVRGFDDHELVELKPGASLRHDMTLLRGFEGALFPAPGAYEVRVDVTWRLDGLSLRVSGSGAVMVTAPQNAAHAEAALAVLAEPDTLLVLALGGDHLEKGIAAVKTALADPVLRPHFAVAEAKRLGRRFGSRAADLDAAFACIEQGSVMSAAEIRSLAGLVQRTKRASRKQGPTRELIDTLAEKVGQVPADGTVVETVKKL